MFVRPASLSPNAVGSFALYAEDGATREIRPWAGGVGGRAPVQDVMYLWPFPTAQRLKFNKVMTETTVAAAAGGVLRLGLYYAPSYWPVTLVEDYGTVAADGATGQKQISLAGNARVIQPGLYYTAVVAQVNTGSTVRAGSTPPLMTPIGITQPNIIAGWQTAATVTGALPATVPPLSPFVVTTCPFFGMGLTA